jgi:hypothetical protein
MKDENLKKAFDILWQTRENLLKFLSDEVIEKGNVLSGKTTYEGALGFEYQEIDNKYMGRLASLNTFLHNLSTAPATQPRRVSVTNQVEVVVTTAEEMQDDINAALKKYPSLKLVGLTVREAQEGKLMVVMAFSSP